MTVRLAKDEDVPEIVDLLKLTLGERLMPKSEQFWRWKHVENPFGASQVLLATHREAIVGVRAFMRWEWSAGGQVYKAVRAVDTATHPDYQGKGIFRKLTLALVDQCRADGDGFVFNTPNTKSKQGYLKMGWESTGRCRVRVRLFPRFRRKHDTDLTAYSVENVLNHELNTRPFVSGDVCTRTNYLPGYVNWRYAKNPNVKYYAVTDHPATGSMLAFFRIKPHAFGSELRLCDVFRGKQFDARQFRELLLLAARRFGATFITFAGVEDLFPFFNLELGIGPEVTILPMNVEPGILSQKSWKPSLGDLEVF